MSAIGVFGAGAFGTSLAIALARAGQPVTLWARDAGHAAAMRGARENVQRLPGFALPGALSVTGDAADMAPCETVLLAVPTQALAGALAAHGAHLSGKPLVACCKGIDLSTLQGPAEVIAAAIPDATPAVLSGPSFAVDIAAGLPTALTLAAADAATAEALQRSLSTPALRLYSSTDVAGVEIGGALKNVIAIACGVAIGAGLGESARAALMTRGYAEMVRFAIAHGAQAETLAGLSGLGDLALTCNSAKSRNFAFGLRLGDRGQADPTVTTEGIATAEAVAAISRKRGIEMPVTLAIAAVLSGAITVAQAVERLMARPLKPE